MNAETREIRAQFTPRGWLEGLLDALPRHELWTETELHRWLVTCDSALRMYYGFDALGDQGEAKEPQ